MSGLRTWLSKEHWLERIVTFDASWFMLNMGTGVIVQNLRFFPWPAQWLVDLSHVLWVFDITLFAFFIMMSTLRFIRYSKVALNAFDDFQQFSFLGAIPISLDSITTGIIIHHARHTTSIWVAELMYWIGVSLTLSAGCGGIFAMYRRRGQHISNEVTGVWLLNFIPLIVTAALGSTLAPHLIDNNASTIIVLSFMMLSSGLGICFMFIGIYLWRLMAYALQPRDIVMSCFVPVGPLAMGAFAALNLSIDVADYVSVFDFDFKQSTVLPVDYANGQAAVARTIEWFGINVCFTLLGLASFFLAA